MLAARGVLCRSVPTSLATARGMSGSLRSATGQPVSPLLSFRAPNARGLRVRRTAGLHRPARARRDVVPIALARCAFVLALIGPRPAVALQPPSTTMVPDTIAPLTRAAAQAAARRISPELRAAREAVVAAVAREHQAAALLNPLLAYGREQTARTGQSNAQDIAQIEQAVEIGGQRSARRVAARLKREVAEARRDVLGQQVDFEVARALATLAAATRREQLANDAMRTFVEAERVLTERLAAGDVSGYATRRLRLESARYAAQRAEVALSVRTARIALASLVGIASHAVVVLPDATLAQRALEQRALEQRALVAEAMPSLDSLRGLALRSRADLRASELDVAIAEADARLAAAERVPSPVLSAGYKRERINDAGAGGAVQLHGFVAGLSLPLPLFDRRRGNIVAAQADTRRLSAEADGFRRSVLREVEEAYESWRAIDGQLALLRPQLGESAQIALRAVQTAYTEGEITLVEWLDAVRAYQDAESTLTMLEADAVIRRALLERAVGQPLFASDAR